MSKRTYLAALASVALLAACDKSKEDEIVSVSFSSFGFYAKDNADVLKSCPSYTPDAADERPSGYHGGRRTQHNY